MHKDPLLFSLNANYLLLSPNYWIHCTESTVPDIPCLIKSKNLMKNVLQVNRLTLSNWCTFLCNGPNYVLLLSWDFGTGKSANSFFFISICIVTAVISHCFAFQLCYMWCFLLLDNCGCSLHYIYMHRLIDIWLMHSWTCFQSTKPKQFYNVLYNEVIKT